MAERVLVIGACGFIGRAVSTALRRQGMEIIGFDLATHPQARTAGGAHIDGSVTDRAALSNAVRRLKPDTVISLAAFSRPSIGLAISADVDHDAAFAVNVDGLRNVIEVAVAHGVRRVIWSSSTVVLGAAAPDRAAALDETAPTAPVNVYGLTKVLAEQMSSYAHRVMELDIAAVRPTLVMGPDHPYSGILDPLKRLFSHPVACGPVDLSWGTHRFDIVHVDDVAHAILALCQRPGRLSQIYHVNGGPTTASEVVDTVKALRPDLEVRLSESAPDTVYPLVSAGRIAAETGFVPRFTPQDVIADCVGRPTARHDYSKGGINA